MTQGYVERQIKERHRRFVRTHWWRLGAVAAAIAGLGIGTWLVVPGSRVPLWAVVPALCLTVLGAAWDQLTGTYHLVSGRNAQRWTSRELKKVCGRGWHVIDGLPFDRYDVDHVLVGPGGVYAVETKYTDDVVDFTSLRGRSRAKSWTGQARRGARSVGALLLELGVDVYPVVVAWGNEVSHTPYVDDTRPRCPVLHGRDLGHATTPWRRGIQILSAAEVETIIRLLSDH